MKQADPFYLSTAWRETRWQVLRRDSFRCVWCGRDVRAKGWARVDHIKPRRTHPALALTLSNLRTLCRVCDAKRHAEKGRGTDAYGAAPDGTPLDRGHWWHKPAKPRRTLIDYRMRRAEPGGDPPGGDDLQ